MAKSKKEKEIEAAAKAELEQKAQDATEAQEAAQEAAGAPEVPQAEPDIDKSADGTEGASGGQEDEGAAQEAAGTPEASQADPEVEKTEPSTRAGRTRIQGNVLVIYNGFVNLRRSPSMDDDNIMGQAGRGTVLNAIAEVESDGHKWYETTGEVYIRADEALVEFMRK